MRNEKQIALRTKLSGSIVARIMLGLDCIGGISVGDEVKSNKTDRDDGSEYYEELASRSFAHSYFLYSLAKEESREDAMSVSATRSAGLAFTYYVNAERGKIEFSERVDWMIRKALSSFTERHRKLLSDSLEWKEGYAYPNKISKNIAAGEHIKSVEEYVALVSSFVEHFEFDVNPVEVDQIPSE